MSSVPPIRRQALLLAATLCLIAPWPAAAVAAQDPAGQSLPGPRVMVKLRAAGDGPAQGAALADLVKAALERAGAGGGRLDFTSRTTRWRGIALNPGADAAAVMRELAADPAVEAVEPERFALTSGTMPDDLEAAQWSLDNTGQSIDGTAGVYDADIDAPEAWDLTRGDLSVTVAVLDTGVHTDHPDLGENLVRGYDFVNQDADPWDDAGFGHGTPVAGIIGAVGNNGTGMAGINWSVSLLPVKVCDRNGSCPYSSIVAGLEYATARGARVVNMSMACDEHQNPATGQCGASRAGACRSEMLRDALAAARASGVLAVVSAGNCGADVDDSTRAYPCAYDLDNVLCVGATDSRDELAAFSNHGPRHVRVAAPGSSVLSLSTDAATALLWDGTSFSAPMAAGVAALQLSRNRTFTPAALAARVAGGDAMASLDGLIGGASRLNARKSIEDLFLSPTAVSSSPGGTLNLTGDFDGDGLADACEASASGGHRVATSDGAGLGPFQTWSPSAPSGDEVVGDFNGDGRADLARAASAGIEVMLSQGSGFAAPARWSAEGWKKGLTYAADVDGDGRADLVRYLGKRRFRVALSTGTGFAASQRWSGLGAGSARAFGDVNADGRADMLRATSSGLEVSLSTGASFAAPTLWGPAARPGAPLRAADVDGDGRADLVRYVGPGGCWEASLSGGAAFSAARPWSCGVPGTWSLADFNGDGRADLVTLGAASGWQTMLSSR